MRLTKEQAIAFYESGAWKHMEPAERFRFQLYQQCLCMPFDKFHEGAEAALGRPVWSHEFADQHALITEYEGTSPPPKDFQEIYDKLVDMVSRR